MKRAYCIFNDFNQEAIDIIKQRVDIELANKIVESVDKL